MYGSNTIESQPISYIAKDKHMVKYTTHKNLNALTKMELVEACNQPCQRNGVNQGHTFTKKWKSLVNIEGLLSRYKFNA